MSTEESKDSTLRLKDYNDTGKRCCPDREHQIVRRLDYKLMPFLAIIYLLSYLDRVNIGYAKLLNLEKDLNLTNGEYSWCLSIFFFGYILFELPSNLVLKRCSPPRWISRIMVTWGAVTISMAFVKNFYSLLFARFMLGVFEAGLSPGIIFYLSFWYTKKEQGTRIALFLSAALVAGSLGGFIAYSIDKINLVFGLKSWQWIFILEGIPSVIIGIVTWFYLPSQPNETSWFNTEDKNILIARLHSDNIEVEAKKLDKKQFIDCFKDYKLYFYLFMSIGIGTTINCMALLLPTIIKDSGFSSSNSLLMAPLPYIVSLFTSLAASYHSDKKGERGYHLITSASVSVIGYLIMIFFESHVAPYLGACLVIIGATSAGPILLSWMSNNINGSTKSAVASALTVSFANFGGILAGQLYKSKSVYIISSAFNLTLILLAIVLSLLLVRMLRKDNIKRMLDEKTANNLYIL